MRENFKLGIPDAQCEALLKWHFEHEVESRGEPYLQERPQETCLGRVSDWLTKPTPCFGLTLTGVTGSGKTTTIKAIRGLFNRLRVPDPVPSGFSSPYAGVWMVTARELYRMFSASPSRFQQCRETYFLAIDELGTEDVNFMQYGNNYKPIEELLTYRYDSMLPTIIATNLPLKEVRSKYGDRLADRFNEMMLVVKMPDINFRDTKK